MEKVEGDGGKTMAAPGTTSTDVLLFLRWDNLSGCLCTVGGQGITDII